AATVCTQCSSSCLRCAMYWLSASLISQLFERRDSPANAASSPSTSGRNLTVVTLILDSCHCLFQLQCITTGHVRLQIYSSGNEATMRELALGAFNIQVQPSGIGCGRMSRCVSR